VHPTLRILSLIFLAVAVQFMQLSLLVIVLGVLLAMALSRHAALLRKVMSRSRWLLLTLLLVYAFTTPGEYVQGWGATVAPTYEGLSQGLLQGARLILMLTGLVILLGTTSRPEVMAGIYLLLKPLRFMGISVDRFTARLWLTMHYVEEGRPPSKTSFWALFESVDASDGHAAIDTVRFSLPPMTRYDGIAVLALAILAIWGMACV
jgi:energy-coupling factor transporter transmembrane protein EcfT